MITTANVAMLIVSQNVALLRRHILLVCSPANYLVAKMLAGPESTLW